MKQNVVVGVPDAGVALFGDDFLADIDKAFETLKVRTGSDTGPRKPRRRAKSQGVEAMQATFVEVTRAHLRPVLRYLKAIHQGVASKELCEIVRYVIGPLIPRTRKVGLDAHTKALISFQRVLNKAAAASSRKLSAEHREGLCSAFDAVRSAFGLEFRGHSTAVVNLLGFFKALKRRRDVTDNDLRKLFAIGIPSLTMLRKTSLEELASLSGIPRDRMSPLRSEARSFSVLSVI